MLYKILKEAEVRNIKLFFHTKLFSQHYYQVNIFVKYDIFYHGISFTVNCCLLQTSSDHCFFIYLFSNSKKGGTAFCNKKYSLNVFYLNKYMQYNLFLSSILSIYSISIFILNFSKNTLFID